MRQSKDYLLLDFNEGQEAVDEIETITHRRHSKKLTQKEKDAMKHIESLDFSDIDNILLRKYISGLKKRSKIFKTFGKWVICTLIGIFVGIIVYCLKESVDKLQELKFHQADKFTHRSKAIPFFVYLSFNLLYALLSCACVLFFGPLTSSSGLPEVKGYLNGIRIQKAFNLKTVIGKIVSLILSFSSGLVLGPEGPMFHIGSGIGSSISQFKSKTLGIHLKQFWRYQNDSDKRDFISCGAAAGIAAAFGAPIGGVLFVLEEGSSFWSRQLTWRTFFSCLVATLVANFFLQGFGVDIKEYGLLSFGIKANNLYSYTELVPFCFMGVIGGLLGALFVHLNIRLNYLRKKFLAPRHKLWRLAEVAAVVLLTSLLCYFPALMASCRELPDQSSSSAGCDGPGNDPIETVQFFCPEGFYNPLASLTFTTPDAALKLLYSRQSSLFTAPVLLTFSIFFLILSIITSGLYVASGVFIPMMLVGGAWGRMIGIIINHWTKVDSSLFALIGSSAMMGGSLRMTISLVVIMAELTEGTQYLLPVILVVMMSKWTGDAFNESVYEHLIELKGIPYLPSQPSKQMMRMTVSDVMAPNVVTLPEIAPVRMILEHLHNTSHNGFPVVMIPHLHADDMTSSGEMQASGSGKPSPLARSLNLNDDSNSDIFDTSDFSLNSNINNSNENTPRLRSSFTPMHKHETSESDLFHRHQREGKTLCGLILRSQLSVLLKRKIFIEANEETSINFLSFDGANDLPIDYPEFTTELASKIPSIEDITKLLTPQEMEKSIDLRPYMNFAIVSIKNYSSLSEAYRLFRLGGLRHVVVVNVFNQIVDVVKTKSDEIYAIGGSLTPSLSIFTISRNKWTDGPMPKSTRFGIFNALHLDCNIFVFYSCSTSYILLFEIASSSISPSLSSDSDSKLLGRTFQRTFGKGKN
eukprot:gene6992-8122_t